MNTLLWALQVLGALMYGASGVMKVFMFDKVSGDVRSTQCPELRDLSFGNRTGRRRKVRRVFQRNCWNVARLFRPKRPGKFAR